MDYIITKPDAEGTRQVLDAAGAQIGTLTPPKYAKSKGGYFLKLDGVTWQNSPGARQTADSGFFEATYVKSLTQAYDRINRHFEDKANAQRT